MLKRNSTAKESPNLINESTAIQGNNEARESLRIDGKVEGDSPCSGRLVIGKKGHIVGNMACQHLELLGRLTGNVLAHESSALRSTAVLSGNLSTAFMQIEQGAQFLGQCTMLNVQL
jgi:cytoskeletal protein CcmA (bactofilin family)